MKTCPNCWSQNSDYASYCECCGHPLFKKCPNCGAQVKPSSKYCPDCGTAIGDDEKNEESKTFYVRGVSFKMIFVKGGTFMMGSSEGDEDTQPDERPRHKVTLSDFYIGEIRVSAELWKAVTGDIPLMDHEWTTYSGYTEYKNTYKPGFPVESSSFGESEYFIDELNKITGEKFRFPTEAEWEYAARGGQKSRGYRYAGSDDYDAIGTCDRNPHPYKQKKPNELGLYDMCDTQWEWCSDYYDFDYYKSSPQFNPCNTEESSKRVTRGGCDSKYCHRARPTYRGSFKEKAKGGLLSLRLAMSI